MGVGVGAMEGESGERGRSRNKELAGLRRGKRTSGRRRGGRTHSALLALGPDAGGGGGARRGARDRRSGWTL